MKRPWQNFDYNSQGSADWRIIIACPANCGSKFYPEAGPGQVLAKIK